MRTGGRPRGVVVFMVAVLAGAACSTVSGNSGAASLIGTTALATPLSVPSTTTVPASTIATLAPTTTTTAAPTTTTTLATTATTAAPTTTMAVTTTTAPPGPTVPVVLDEDVAALPDGNGARIAVVVDDVGGVEGSLADYLALPMPVTLSVIPFFNHATAQAERSHAAGKEVLLHLPLSNREGHGDGVSRLVGTETPEAIDAFVQSAFALVPYAVGANNHEGSFGSTLPELMRPLVASLQRRGLFFLDSVTTQKSVGYAVEGELGMDRRVNNQFLDHDLTDENSRAALLHLALLASRSGTGIGICHVYHPFALHALQTIGAQLQAKGYVFVPVSQVTNHLQGGLDVGMKATLPTG